MPASKVKRGILVGLLATMFVAGFLCGSLNQRQANAQLDELKDLAGKAALQQAGAMGGAVGSLVELGTAIVDMQKHVDGLQNNIDTLKKVKSALGG